jgi:type III pantothenate kinase
VRTLCIDIGNTRCKYALYEDGVFVLQKAVSEEGLLSLLQDNKLAVDRVILSSVRKTDDQLLSLLTRYNQSLVLGPSTSLPIGFSYTSRETLGNDRIALACAAVQQFPGQATLVISLGTCVTYNLITADACLAGGSISPGWQMRLDAMHHFTQRLPQLEANSSVAMLAHNTNDNLQSGAYYGLLYELQGIIQAYSADNAVFNVVLTGGNCAQFAASLKCRIFADSNFLFSGLYSISEFCFGDKP